MTAPLRLLYAGLSGKTPGFSAQPFSPDELAASPLCPASDSETCFAPGRFPASPPPGETPGEKGVAVFSDGKERDPQCAGLPFLERPWPDLPGPLYLAGKATSSLDIAHALMERELLPEWGSVLVLSQIAGRGQLRREWSSPAGNLYAALRLPRTAPLNSEAAAPALGGLVADALNAQGFPVALKWPNDILQEQVEERTSRPVWRKAGGILLEERADALIAGIGINLASAPPASLLRDGHAFAAGRLLSSCQDAAKNAVSVFSVWVRLVRRVFFCYSDGRSGSVTAWWPSLAQKHLAFAGWRARLDDATPEHASAHDPDESGPGVEGIIDGLCASGALRLRTKSGTRTFLGGSLTPLGPSLKRGEHGLQDDGRGL